jgi:hypothetical protein
VTAGDLVRISCADSPHNGKIALIVGMPVSAGNTTYVRCLCDDAFRMIPEHWLTSLKDPWPGDAPLDLKMIQEQHSESR